jgi:hypothetical protein
MLWLHKLCCWGLLRRRRGSDRGSWQWRSSSCCRPLILLHCWSRMPPCLPLQVLLRLLCCFIPCLLLLLLVKRLLCVVQRLPGLSLYVLLVLREWCAS